MHLGTVGAAIGFGCFSNVQLFIDLSAEETVSSGGSKGGRVPHATRGPNSFNFVQKIWAKLYVGVPPPSWLPLLGGNPGSATGKTVITPVSVSSIKSKKNRIGQCH